MLLAIHSDVLATDLDPIVQSHWPAEGRGTAQSVAITNGYAYIAAGYGGLIILDISNPAHPEPVGGYYTGGYANGISVLGRYAHLPDGELGLAVLDISDPTDPQRVGGYRIGSSAEAADSGNHAYLARGSAGLEVIDIGNPASPHLLGSYDTRGTAYR